MKKRLRFTRGQKVRVRWESLDEYDGTFAGMVGLFKRYLPTRDGEMCLVSFDGTAAEMLRPSSLVVPS